MIIQTRGETLRDTGARAEAKRRRRGATEALTRDTGIAAPVKSGTENVKPKAIGQTPPKSQRNGEKAIETTTVKQSAERGVEAERGKNRSCGWPMQVLVFCVGLALLLRASLSNKLVAFDGVSSFKLPYKQNVCVCVYIYSKQMQGFKYEQQIMLLINSLSE